MPRGHYPRKRKGSAQTVAEFFSNEPADDAVTETATRAPSRPARVFMAGIMQLMATTPGLTDADVDAVFQVLISI